MSEVKVDIVVDDKELEEGKTAIASFARNIRRSAEIGLAFAQAFGFNIDTVLRMAIQTGLRTIEFITAAFAVESLATLGISGALRLGAQAGAVALMFAQINALINRRTINARELGFATTALRLMTF